MHTCMQARMLVQTPNVNKAAWSNLVPAIGWAVMPLHLASQRKANVSHDNETFLNHDNVYKKYRMSSVKFPPNSGDLNPIGTALPRFGRARDS